MICTDVQLYDWVRWTRYFIQTIGSHFDHVRVLGLIQSPGSVKESRRTRPDKVHTSLMDVRVRFSTLISPIRTSLLSE